MPITRKAAQCKMNPSQVVRVAQTIRKMSRTGRTDLKLRSRRSETISTATESRVKHY